MQNIISNEKIDEDTFTMETFCHDDEYRLKNLYKKDSREFKGGNNNNNTIHFETYLSKNKKELINEENFDGNIIVKELCTDIPLHIILKNNINE